MKYDFITTVYDDDAKGWLAIVEGADGTDEAIDDVFDSQAEAEAAGRGFREGIEAANIEWQREIAREEGMLAGCDAYNDYMGY